MDHLHDSTALLHDPHALRTRLVDEGYLFFRRLIPPDEVTPVGQVALQGLDRFGWLDPDDPEGARPGPRVVNEGDEEFFEPYAHLQSGEAFHALAHHDALGTVMGRLVDDDLLVHPRKIVRVGFPDNPRGVTPPHQDFRYIQGTTDVFTAWMPLMACPQDLGGLRVLRGSHTGGLHPVVGNDGVQGITIPIDDRDPDWAIEDYEPGDVLVFHSLTVHAATPNRAGRLRLSADYRYQAASEPLAQSSLKPHWWPRIPDWPELVTDWASLAPIAAPPDPEITEFVWGTEQVPPSRFFDFPRAASN